MHRRNAGGPLKVDVLLDLERRPDSGGHVKFWERVAEAVPAVPSLELELHFQGPEQVTRQMGEGVTLSQHCPIMSSRLVPGLNAVPDHADLSPWHPGLAARLRNADLVHCTDGLFAFALTARRVCRWRGIPLVTSLHTDTVSYAGLYAREHVGRWLARTRVVPARALAAAAARQVERLARARLRRHLQASDFVLASGALHRSLAQVVPEHKLHNLRRGLDRTLFHASGDAGERDAFRRELGLPAGAFLVSFCGRLSAGKNVLRVARVVRRLNESGIETHAVFAGIGAQEAAVRECLGVRAHLLGQAPQAEVARMMRASDLFMFPSQVEVWPNVVAEARACGVAVMVDASGGGQLLRESGVDGIVVADSDADWLEHGRRLLLDPRRRASLASEGLRVAAIDSPSWRTVLEHDLLQVWSNAQRLRGGQASAAAPASART